jgi:hypothetical protein
VLLAHHHYDCQHRPVGMFQSQDQRPEERQQTGQPQFNTVSNSQVAKQGFERPFESRWNPACFGSSNHAAQTIPSAAD